MFSFQPRVVPMAESKKPLVNADAIELVEGMLERLKAGEVVAVAVVEVLQDRAVANHYSKSADCYHHLMSGVARLHARMAIE
jgi:hypothetical protein